MRLLLALALLASSAQALAEDCVADLGGVLDGNVTPIPPANINIDGVCRIMNYPGGMSTNFAFYTSPGQNDERWIVIFDNVLHTGQMACNAVAGHKIWFVNGSSSTIQQQCQNLLIPVEKIDKESGGAAVRDGRRAVHVPATIRCVRSATRQVTTSGARSTTAQHHGLGQLNGRRRPRVLSHTMTWSGQARRAHVHERFGFSRSTTSRSYRPRSNSTSTSRSCLTPPRTRPISRHEP
jgi:hypothetical protein